MDIDFKEIPKANKGGGKQDTFELFARDCLVELGFEIIRHPDRGPDGKKDMIVREVRNGVGGKTIIDWLVSCKHFAHSKTSRGVKDTDEPSPTERLTKNKCQGFIGFYSTIATSSLSDMLFGCKDKFESQVYDYKRITQIVLKQKGLLLFKSYFTNNYEKYKHLFSEHNTTNSKKEEKRYKTDLSEEDLLRINITAILIVKLAEIEDKYGGMNWEQKEGIITELYKYSKFSNFRIAEVVLDFLSGLADQTRGGMTEGVAVSIFSLTLDFFPYSEGGKQKKKIVELGEKSTHIAFSMVYDAAIYLNNYDIIMYGLSILKYIYKKGREEKFQTLIDKVNKTYDEIEETLQRPERNDLGTALELVRVFRADIGKGNLAFPNLPEHLHKIIYPYQ